MPTRPAAVLGGIFVVAGIAHFVRPATFEQIVPSQLPAQRELVYASGLVELICAYGLLRDRRWAPWASVVLLSALFPANIKMMIDALADPESSLWYRFATIVRLPIQGLLVAMAMVSRRKGDIVINRPTE